MRTKRRAVAAGAVLVAVLLPWTASAQPVPQRVSFAARIADNGAPVEGTHDFVLALFDSASSTSALWSETRSAQTVTNGLVSFELGEVTPLGSVFDGQGRYLEVTVDGTTMSPRVSILSVPYALRAASAADADTLGGLAKTAFQPSMSSACPPGEFISAVAADGGVVCSVPPVSGADITSVVAGSGLSGGATSGDATLALMTCLPPQILKMTLSGWQCDNDLDSGGDITSVAVAAGGGLVGGGASGDTTLALLNCVPPQILRMTLSGWQCDNDLDSGGDITSVSVGSGLSGGATSGNAAISLMTCPEPQILKMGPSGWQCDDDLDSGGDITGVTAGNGLSGGGATGNLALSVNFPSSGGDNGTAISAARSDHLHDSRYQRAYAKTFIVSPQATPALSGTALLAAVTTASGLAAAANPILLKLEPGVYDVGSSRVQLPAYVDLEGSGRRATVIQGLTGGSFVQGVVRVLGDSEVRSLSVVCSGGAGFAGVAFYFAAGSSPRLVDVFASASGGTSGAHALRVDAVTLLVIERSEIFVTSTATSMAISSVAPLEIRQTRITAVDGTSVTGISTTSKDFILRESEVIASPSVVVASGISGVSLNAAALAGTVELRNVTVRVSGVAGSVSATGVRLASTLGDTMRVANLVVQITGAVTSVTGLALSSGVVTIHNTEINARTTVGGSGAVALNISNSFVSAADSSFSASSPANSTGILSTESSGGPYPGYFDAVQAIGATAFSGSASAPSTATFHFGASQLVGSVTTNNMQRKCVHSYNLAYDPLLSTCLP